MSLQDLILIFHVSNILFSIATLFVIVLNLVKQKWFITTILWSIPMAMWMLHGLVFHTFLFINNYFNLELLLPVTINFWSAVYITQGLLTFFSIELARYINSNMIGGRNGH
jgi:hypothetical protein